MLTSVAVKGGKLALEIQALLDEMEPAQSVGAGQLFVDGRQALGDALGCPLASTPRTV